MTPGVIITGASGGIGRALCVEFKKNGYFTLGVDKEPEAPKEADAYLCFDLSLLAKNESSQESFKREVESRFKGHALKSIINNAAVQILGSTDQIKIKDWEDTLQLNLLAPFFVVQLFKKTLSEQKGSVINIASIHASLTKSKFICYATSKSALIGLTRALALDLAPHIRVNAISPAATDTPMLREGFKDSPEKMKELSDCSPLGRIATPAEVAKVAVFLSSSDSSFISGSTIQVDGAVGCRLHDPV
ncbi:MAG: hypothetical protein JWQ35_605 [Bacteriovoracaceae bacterium]|nr:hypothetical protein [Bacteriovoracaceae bacterium]